jgi:peptidoglycan/LPS O-acetylase OafA/YrhL
MRYFDEIVGLRIYLALWVAVNHALQLAGYVRTTNPVIAFLTSGHEAVMMFIIVSGFVITNLLLSKQESYECYITRRFFRLYPAYILCGIAGYFAAAPWAWIVQTAPWQTVPGWTDYARGIVELRDELAHNFWPHLLLHLGMVHGLVPNEILNRAPMTILPAAWSVSLEWQFYLIAPLVIAATHKRWRLAGLLAAALLVYVAYRKDVFGHYAIGSSILGAWPYFAIGIASRLAYPALATLRVPPVPAMAGVLVVGIAFAREPLPIVLWGLFMVGSLWREGFRPFARVFELLFMSGPAQRLGEASYSLYLVHRPVQVALGALALSSFALDRPTMLAVQLAAILVAIPVSLALYFAVERPGMALGRRVAERLPTAKALAPAAEPAQRTAA